jgi:uncharacterized membrane protein
LSRSTCGCSKQEPRSKFLFPRSMHACIIINKSLPYRSISIVGKHLVLFSRDLGLHESKLNLRCTCLFCTSLSYTSHHNIVVDTLLVRPAPMDITY